MSNVPERSQTNKSLKGRVGPLLKRVNSLLSTASGGKHRSKNSSSMTKRSEPAFRSRAAMPTRPDATSLTLLNCEENGGNPMTAWYDPRESRQPAWMPKAHSETSSAEFCPEHETSHRTFKSEYRRVPVDPANQIAYKPLFRDPDWPTSFLTMKPIDVPYEKNEQPSVDQEHADPLGREWVSEKWSGNVVPHSWGSPEEGDDLPDTSHCGSRPQQFAFSNQTSKKD
jgi:hypothetical protein